MSKKRHNEEITPRSHFGQTVNRHILLLYLLLSHTSTRSLSSQSTKAALRSIDRIMRNREKLLQRNEKRKFVIRQRFPPLLYLSLSHNAKVYQTRARPLLVLRAGLFLSVLATLFSLLYSAESGLSCLFEWTVAPLHGINIGWHKRWGQRVGLLNQGDRSFDYIVSIEQHCSSNEGWLEQITFLFLLV